jgi:hypothetical protein
MPIKVHEIMLTLACLAGLLLGVLAESSGKLTISNTKTPQVTIKGNGTINMRKLQDALLTEH